MGFGLSTRNRTRIKTQNSIYLCMQHQKDDILSIQNQSIKPLISFNSKILNKNKKKFISKIVKKTNQFKSFVLI